MVRNAVLENVVFSPRWKAASIRMQFDDRGAGWFLAVLASVGLLVLGLGIMLSDGQRSVEKTELVFYLTFGLVTFVGCGLGATYLFTRYQWVRIKGGQVIVKRGWLLRRSSRCHDLTEFRGLQCYSRVVRGHNATTAGLSVLGLMAAGVTGVGATFRKNDKIHLLKLVHLRHKSLDLVLLCDEDATAILTLAAEMTAAFNFHWIPGQAGLGCGHQSMPGHQAETPISARSHGTAEPDDCQGFGALVPSDLFAALSRPPLGIDVQAAGDRTSILLPANYWPLAVGIACAVPMVVCGFLALAQLPHRDSWLVAPLFFVGFLSLVAGLVISRRGELHMTPQGFLYAPSLPGIRPILHPWNQIRDVSVEWTVSRKYGVLIRSSIRDIWIGVGMADERLQWLCRVIRVRAALR